MNNINVWNYKKELKNFSQRKYNFEQVEDLEDFVEDVLIKAHSKLHLFNPNKSKINTWIINISRNHYIDKYVRKKKVEAKYKPIETMVYLSETIDLNAFEKFLQKKDKDLQTLYYLRKKDLEIDDILLSMNITLKEYKNLFKNLKQLKNEFFEEI